MSVQAFKPISIPIQDEKHWHQLRSENVGASDVAALFGVSPYRTKFTLFYQKAGKLLSPDFDSERLYWGNMLEPVIAQGVAEKQEWKVRKVRRYLLHPTITGMGTSLDYEIFNHPDGPGCLEIKNLSIEAWSKNWLKNEDGSIEAPIHIELQLQHQLAVTGRAWGAIGFLVGGNQLQIVIRKRHEATIQKIEQAVAEFWTSVKEEKPPGIEEAGDLVALTQIFDGAHTVDLDTDEFETLVRTYDQAREAAKEADSQKEEAKAHLVAFLNSKDAEIVLGRGFKVSYKLQKKKEYVVRASESRVLRVSAIKEKGE